MSDLKLVFHVNENDRWPFSIRSAENFLRSDDTGEGSHVTIVANGAAVRSFSQLEAEPHRMARIRELHDLGARFVVCAIALEQRQVKRELIPEYVEVVPAGVVEIAKLQDQGYGYIKA